MKPVYMILTIAFALILGIGIGWGLNEWERDRYVISFRGLQESLVARGAEIKVDGRICSGWATEGHSETLDAWDKILNNQSAERSWPK